MEKLEYQQIPSVAAVVAVRQAQAVKRRSSGRLQAIYPTLEKECAKNVLHLLSCPCGGRYTSKGPGGNPTPAGVRKTQVMCSECKKTRFLHLVCKDSKHPVAKSWFTKLDNTLKAHRKLDNCIREYKTESVLDDDEEDELEVAKQSTVQIASTGSTTTATNSPTTTVPAVLKAWDENRVLQPAMTAVPKKKSSSDTLSLLKQLELLASQGPLPLGGLDVAAAFPHLCKQLVTMTKPAVFNQETQTPALPVVTTKDVETQTMVKKTAEMACGPDYADVVKNTPAGGCGGKCGAVTSKNPPSSNKPAMVSEKKVASKYVRLHYRFTVQFASRRGLFSAWYDIAHLMGLSKLVVDCSALGLNGIELIVPRANTHLVFTKLKQAACLNRWYVAEEQLLQYPSERRNSVVTRLAVLFARNRNNPELCNYLKTCVQSNDVDIMISKACSMTATIKPRMQAPVGNGGMLSPSPPLNSSKSPTQPSPTNAHEH